MTLKSQGPTASELPSCVVESVEPVLSGWPQGVVLYQEEAETLLRQLLSSVEQSMALRCRRHSKMMLLSSLRQRFSPAGLVDAWQFPFIALAPMKTLTLASLKYGASILEPLLSHRHLDVSFPFSASERQDLDELIFLSIYYSRLEQIWRSLWYDCGVELGGQDVNWVANEKHRAHARLGNARLELNSLNTLAPAAGLHQIELSPEQMAETSWSQPVVLFGVFMGSTETGAAKEIRVASPEYHGGKEFQVKYVGFPQNIQAVLNLASSYRGMFMRQNRLTLSEFAMCVKLLSLMQTDGNMRWADFFQDFCNTGLGVFDAEDTRRMLIGMVKKRQRAWKITTSATLVVHRFFRNMVLDGDRLEDLKIHGGWLPSCFYRFGTHLVCDWVSVPWLLNSIVYGLSQGAEMKNIKGRQFEIALCDWLKTRVTCEHLFRPGTKLKREGRVLGDVDLSFRHGSVGYVVECKAYSANLRLLRGDRGALRKRWYYVEDWIAQASRTVKRISEHPSGDNYRLADGIEYLVPVVCSPNVEPIWPLDGRHMITARIPRVCTPNELVKLLGLQPDEVLSLDECATQVGWDV